MADEFRRNDSGWNDGNGNGKKTEKTPVVKPVIHIDQIMKDYKILVEEAKILGKYLKDIGVKSSQFRRIFTHIKRLHVEININTEKDNPLKDEKLKKVLILKPKMAYTAGRHDNLRFLYEKITEFVDKIERVNDYNIFYDFIEASLAYHKYFGGKE